MYVLRFHPQLETDDRNQTQTVSLGKAKRLILVAGSIFHRSFIHSFMHNSFQPVSASFQSRYKLKERPRAHTYESRRHDCTQHQVVRNHIIHTHLPAPTVLGSSCRGTAPPHQFVTPRPRAASLPDNGNLESTTRHTYSRIYNHNALI